eukprot:scaffold374_cov124-Cylindrotheca_fusiformis.AAC.7
MSLKGIPVFKLLLASCCTLLCADGFQFGRLGARKSHGTIPRLQPSSYSRGAEIWPPTNEDSVHLTDTFPNGQVPYSAVVTIGQQDMEVVHESVEETINGTVQPETSTPRRSKRRFVSRSIRRILRRAAAKEELDSEGEIVSMDRTPIVVAVALLVQGLVRPLDIIVVSCISFYLIVLGMIARSPRENSDAPILPSVPPQGHVPAMVSNPLGMGIKDSLLYDSWLKIGVIIGLIGPVLLLARLILVEKDFLAARVCARPTFLLCCQAISEALSRRAMVRRSELQRCVDEPV